MAKSNENPNSLSEAIAKLENVSQSKMQDFKQILEKDYEEIRKSLDDLKPYLDDLKSSVESEVKKTKKDVEVKIEKNPWVTLAVVGALAFIVGWIFGKKHED